MQYCQGLGNHREPGCGPVPWGLDGSEVPSTHPLSTTQSLLGTGHHLGHLPAPWHRAWHKLVTRGAKVPAKWVTASLWKKTAYLCPGSRTGSYPRRAPTPHPQTGGLAVPGPSQGYQCYLVPSHKPLLTRDLLSHAVLTLTAKPTDQMGQGASPPAPTIWPSAPRKCPLSVLPFPSSSPLRPLPLRRLLAQTPFPCPRSPPSLT